ncbi:serine endoprotease DegQ [Edwardsiella hoshinae]|uniref:Serine endoprotease DegQ n=1 Tax=Edwardsiella hoshinae TaxID=93378 RepID=A0A376DN20_9GAMM|nr:Do family serine endopeptidase [Edwardsiella hoshinae]AOV97939.1 serine endoprotease DegQ [Edwardsiella hoshinae]QPR29182.1 Do family serine endopeptidase [Edwardsiella hoshinae]STC91182.1 Periplasmic pH-dependent serine endoprotease DegQ precursor [Edwardsiella hoshinae]
MTRSFSPLLRTLALSLGLSLATSPLAQASLPSAVNGQPLPSLAPMLAHVLPAVVNIYVGSDQPTGRGHTRAVEAIGSGVIINAAKGYVLTNNHVIDAARHIRVQLEDGREYSARLVGRDAASDIALLQLRNAHNLTEIKLADSDRLRVGDFAVAVGNPFGLGQTATAGIISALGRSGLQREGLENFIQTDASINSGNSGGALLNLKGELVGINTAILAPAGGNIGIGFAIPSNMARNLSDQLIKYGEVRRGVLGIRGRDMTADLAKAFNLATPRGTFVNEVLPKSAAAKAGIHAGDILLSLNGTPISSFAELRAKIGSLAPGTTLHIGLLRNGKPLNVSVTLDNRRQASVAGENLTPALQGTTLSAGHVAGTAGVLIDTLEKGSPAAQVGLHKTDLIIGVNRIRTPTLQALRKALAGDPPVIALHVIRDGQLMYLLVR